jgi:hypothetical protein
MDNLVPGNTLLNSNAATALLNTPLAMGNHTPLTQDEIDAATEELKAALEEEELALAEIETGKKHNRVLIDLAEARERKRLRAEVNGPSTGSTAGAHSTSSSSTGDRLFMAAPSDSGIPSSFPTVLLPGNTATVVTFCCLDGRLLSIGANDFKKAPDLVYGALRLFAFLRLLEPARQLAMMVYASLARHSAAEILALIQMNALVGKRAGSTLHPTWLSAQLLAHRPVSDCRVLTNLVLYDRFITADFRFKDSTLSIVDFRAESDPFDFARMDHLVRSVVMLEHLARATHGNSYDRVTADLVENLQCGPLSHRYVRYVVFEIDFCLAMWGSLLMREWTPELVAEYGIPNMIAPSNVARLLSVLFALIPADLASEILYKDQYEPKVSLKLPSTLTSKADAAHAAVTPTKVSPLSLCIPYAVKSLFSLPAASIKTLKGCTRGATCGYPHSIAKAELAATLAVLSDSTQGSPAFKYRAKGPEYKGALTALIAKVKSSPTASWKA